ncbi:DUF262 domain-containing protein [Kibdelosporangium lantanae]|uniref:DUF262 domain-containing protein n=1 Tax=Kibdelosporangium lantanae TaxID=1497396 RepID=A0ABW3M335_9PSEU
MSAGLDTRPNAITFDLDELITKAWQGEIRVPHFQRPFRWGREDVRRLFDSVVNGYPIGSLLLWVRPAPKVDDLVLGSLHIDAPALPQAWWVVDGQQRITSLANALHPDGAKDARFSLGYDLETRQFVAMSTASDKTVPLPVLFNLVELIKWFNERPEIQSLLDRASTVATTIRQFKVPAYQVKQDDIGVLQDIFDRLNNYGKRLSRAEIFTALNAGVEDDAESQLTIPLIGENISAERGFGVVDGGTVLQAILARRNPDVLRDIRNEFSGRGGIDFPDEDRDTAYELTQRALLQAVEFLQEHAFVPHIGVLPYRNLLVVLTRFFAHHPEPGEHNLRLLRRWFWRAATIGPEGFTGGTTGAIRALCAAIKPGRLTDSVQSLLELASSDQRSMPDVRHFRTNQSRTKILLCALWSASPRSPETLTVFDRADLAEALTDQSTAANAVRHIIARRDVPDELRQYAANRVLMPKLSATDSEVLPSLLRRPAGTSTDEWAEMLGSHLITTEMVTRLGTDGYDGFLRARSQKLHEQVQDFLSRMCEWDFEDTPTLAELDFDDDTLEGDDDLPT